MVTLNVPVVSSHSPDWTRKSANATNELIKRQTASESTLTTATANITALQTAALVADIVTATANYTVLATDRFIINNKAGSGMLLTLPDPTTNAKRILTVKTVQAQTVTSASSNVVPLAGGAAGTAILAATAGKWAQLVSDGTNWVIMAAA